MAAPVIKIKRSSVPGKIPTTASLPLGELALNTNDGKVYIQQDSVGIGSTVIVVNPWSVGLGSNTYNTFFTVGSVGIGTTIPTSSLHVVGDVRVTGVVTATTFVGALTGTATIAQGLTGSPNLNVGVVTATSFSGSGTALTGIVTSIIAGTNITVSGSTGQVTINASGGGGSSQWVTTDVGIHTLSNVGIGTTNPTSKLQVQGNVLVVGIITATNLAAQQLNISGISTFTNGPILVGTATSTGTASQRLQVTDGAYVSGNLGIGTTNPAYALQVQGNARVTGAIYDSTNASGTTGQVLQSTITGTLWATAAAGGGGSGKFDTSIDNVLYIQPTGTLDIVGVGTTTTQITTLPSGSNKYLVHSLHVTNISNGDAEITAGFVLNARKVPATISVSVGSSGGPGIHTFTVGSASSITVGMAVTGTGNIGETTGIGSTAGFQFNTYVTSVDGNNITLSKPMSGRATGVLYFSPVSKISSRLPVPVGSAVELLKQPMILNALDSIVLQSTGAGTGIGSTSTATITQVANSNILTVTAGAAITNFLASGMLIQPTGNNTGIQTNTFVGVGYTSGSLSIPMTRPATVALASTSISFTEVVVPQDGALQVTVVYQSSTDTSYQNGTGTVVAISSNTTSVTAGLSTIPVAYYGTGNVYPSVVQSIRVSNISDGIIYPGGDYPVSVGIGNSDTIFSWLAYNMVIPKNSSIELCEAPKRLGIGQSIFASSSTPNAIEIQIAGKQKTS